MKPGDITINIRLHTDDDGKPIKADIIVNRNGLSKIGRVAEYTNASDLNVEIDRLTGEIHDLRLPDIETKDADIFEFRDGEYKPKPVVEKPKPKSKKKTEPKPKAPFTLWQNKNRRQLLMTDDFELQEELWKTNKKLSFKDLADAKRVAQVLAKQDSNHITIKDKSDNPVATINSDNESNEEKVS